MVAGYSRKFPKALVLIGGVAGLCAAGAWVVTGLWAQNQSPVSSAEPPRRDGATGMELLRARVAAHPRDWRWSLQLARAQWLAGDAEEAEHIMKPLQRLHPDRPEVLAMTSLLALNDQQGAGMIKELEKRFKSMPAGQRLNIGLLLADLQRQAGKTEAATERYQDLIKESPQRPEPLLALALLKRDEGQGNEAIELLRLAMNKSRTRTSSSGKLQTLELRWALEAARNHQIQTGVKADPAP